MKNKKVLFYAGGAALIGLLGFGVYYFGFRKSPKSSEQSGGDTKTEGGSGSGLTIKTDGKVVSNSGWPLMIGSRGEYVAKLQTMLNTKHKTGLKPDGIWGIKTQAAVSKYLNIIKITDAMQYASIIAQLSV